MNIKGDQLSAGREPSCPSKKSGRVSVSAQYPTGALYLEKPDEVARYRLAFDHLRVVALSPDETRRLLARSAEDLE
jgi:Domain of unknown function (DUF5753)